jgi:hypothetical protein
MSWQVMISPQVTSWLRQQSKEHAKRFLACLLELESQGPNLGRPIVDSVKGSKIKNLMELRFGSFRVLFCFDSNRTAQILYAGNKQGLWNQWYPEAISRAEAIFKEIA